MTEMIGLGDEDDAEGAPTRFYDKAGEQISRSQWEILRRDPAYQQVRIHNITGLTARGALIFIRVHTVWTGIGYPCEWPCSGMHLFATYIFDHFDFLESQEEWTYDLREPLLWASPEDAGQGHDAVVRQVLAAVPEGRVHRDLTLCPTLEVRGYAVS